MITYIKKNVKGYYVEFPNELDKYKFPIGTTYKDFIAGKWVLLSDEQLRFHEEHPRASVSEVFFMTLNEPYVPERTIEDARQEMLSRINGHDNGSEVNEFTINGELKAWFTPDERANYRNSIESAKVLGIETLQLFVGDTAVNVPTQAAEQMLSAIQLYADACFIVTKGHKMAVEKLETIEEIDGYDYTTGYPEKLNFDLQ